jgi:hypothetical protein
VGKYTSHTGDEAYERTTQTIGLVIAGILIGAVIAAVIYGWAITAGEGSCSQRVQDPHGPAASAVCRSLGGSQ